MNLSPKDALRGTIHSESEVVRSVVSAERVALLRLGGVELQAERGQAAAGQAMGHTADFDMSLELPEGRKAALREKLEKQLGQLENAARGARGRLANEAFVSKAPEHVVQGLRKKLGDYESQIDRIKGTLSGL